MQKQFKLIDEQLQLNNMLRLPDPIPKPANSFFRALSISIFSTHNQAEYVKSIMKLTLQANCEAYLNNTILKKKKRHHIAFPIISESSELVKKYLNDKQMLQTYFQSPDLDCFQNDNYQLASFTFNRRVSVFYLNKDGYLNQTLISCCRNKRGKKILLTKIGKFYQLKIGKRYFAVEKQATRSMAVFIKEYLLGNLVNKIVTERNDKQNTKVHFMGYDEIIIGSHKKFPKIHKKSLSQCGDIMNKLEQYRNGLEQYRNGFRQEIDESFHTSMKNNYDSIENRSHQQQPKHLEEREFDFCQKEVVRDEKVMENGVQVVQGKGNSEEQQQKQEEVIIQPITETTNVENVNITIPPPTTVTIKQVDTIKQHEQKQQQQQQQNEPFIPIVQDNHIDQQQSQLQQQQQSHQLQKQQSHQLQKQKQISLDNHTEAIPVNDQNTILPIVDTNTYPYGMQYVQGVQYAQNNIQVPATDYAQQQPQQQQIPAAYYQQQQQYMYPYQYYSPQYSQYYNMNINMQQLIYDQQQQYYQQYYQQPQPQPQPYPYSQPQQLTQNNRYRGRLKFYDSNGKYGFIIVDGIGSDLFVHYDDLSKAGITKQQLEAHSTSRQLRFEFTYYQYQGKSKKAKKAIDLQLLTQM